MQAIGHAILADELYATKDTVRKADRLLLHASYISFVHPVTHKLIDIESIPDF
jgi:tRNA pseudouridine32 synthase/23S rRNA pseudouridine746 synthase